MNANIFRAYDIRGVYPTDLDEQAVADIGRAYVNVFQPANVAVGMDVRYSSPQLKTSLAESLMDCGVDVIDLGLIATDMLYFAVGKYGYSGGIIVSASHNPKDYNGMKMVRKNAVAISSDTGLFEIRDAVLGGKLRAATRPLNKGRYEDRDILEDYVDHVLSFIDLGAIKPFVAVANANFGCTFRPARAISAKMGLELRTLNFDPDGSFPKGTPDPTVPRNQRETEDLVRSTGADFGVAWDADGDRVIFIDEGGRSIPGAYAGALLARILLEKRGSSNKVLCDPRVTWPMSDIARETGATAVVTKAGHAFLKDAMRSHNALFAAESSAHYYFRDNFYADNGMIPFALMTEYLSRRGCKMSELFDPFYQGHFLSGELNYTVQDIPGAMDRIRQHFQTKGREDFTDGYSLETGEWRFNVRSSNTEPLLRINVEAKKQQFIESIQAELEKLVIS
jgi:phosphomannomutase